ncbi:MAG: beta-galactosidase [Clostridia bacterium]|nr:beta-galactosidase [Clostridia bacterium]
MKSLLEIKDDKLFFGGEPFYIASGDMHYFRHFKEGWERRLRLMKDFGLNCVQTYVPWNLHEPEKGEFNFSGNLDVAEFLQLCADLDMKVLFRPSPYMCGEWDFGGLPYWLLKDRDVIVRSSEEKYMNHVFEYTKRLSKEFLPYLSTNGGPIIAVAVENEYGSYGSELSYIKALANMLKSLGVDVPLYTANGDIVMHIFNGSLPELWTAVDVRAGTERAKNLLKEFHGSKTPLMVAEQWAGCGQQWGGVFNRTSTEMAAKHYKTSLENGFMVNFYMFCGGTNFGFMAGANHNIYRADTVDAVNRYIPFTTSYDVDAPVNEAGEPTEKYYALKKVLCEYRGVPYEKGEFYHEVQSIGKVNLTECAGFFENVDEICSSKVYSPNVRCMEDLGQDYGYTLYTTDIKNIGAGRWQLNIDGLSDRVIAFGDGKYLGSMMRDRDEVIHFDVPEEGLRLSLLVENMGRICFGYKLSFDRKGISNCVYLFPVDKDTGTVGRSQFMLTGYDINTLPLKDLSGLDYGELKVYENNPAFYKGTFKAKAGVDTYIKLSGWNKGNVWINGFNIGRYWKIGPQETLYVPGELLKEENTIEVFELYTPNEDVSVEFCDKPSLDSIKQNVDALIQAERA